MPRTTAVTFLLAATAAVAACGRADADAAAASARSAPLPVRVVTVGVADLTSAVVASGMTAARDEVALAFKIGGVVETTPAEAGARVQGGALLARLAPTEIRAAVAKAEQGVAKARRDAERARTLHRDSVVTLAQLQDAETALDVAEQDLRVAQFNARYAEVRAPSDGIVLRRLSEPGALVDPGTPIVLFRPSGTGVMLRAGLSDRDAARVRLGDAATVRFDAEPDRSFRGRVARMAAGANPMSGTYDAEIDLEGAARVLASGLVGRVEIFPSRRASRLAVPVEALVEADADSAQVYVVDEAGTKASLRRIRVGRLGAAGVAVLDGLVAGERVVVAGGAYLSDGGAVRIAADAARPREATP